MSNSNADSMGEELANWVLENRIIEHIFGPNSHVEVIKQSHIVLNFVASQITTDHIDVIWSASQMKHCGRQVLDILLPLIKNLKMKPVLHLYWLLKNFEPKDHTEQTLVLASQLLKYIWAQTSGSDVISNTGINTSVQSAKILEDLALVRSPIFTILPGSGQKNRHNGDSSSSSGSVDNSDDEEDDEEYDVDVTQPIVTDPVFRNKGKPRLCNSSNNNSDDSSENTSESDDEEIIIPELSDEKIRSARLHQALVGNYSNSSSSDLVPIAVRDVVAAIHRDNTFTGNQQSVEDNGRSKFDTKDPSFMSKPCNEFSFNMIIKLFSLLQGLTFSDKIQFKIKNESQIEKTPSELQSVSPDLKCAIIPAEQQTPDVMEKLVKMTEGLSSKNDDLSDSRASSRNSRLSDKNMADFEGEESDCDVTKIECNDEFFNQVAECSDYKPSAAHKLASIAQIVKQNLETDGSDKNMSTEESDKSKEQDSDSELVDLSIDNVCKPGRTLLWDLLQDDMIHQLPEGLAHETEKIFWNTVCWSSDRRIRMKFIDGCLDNLAKNQSVNTSLRLLPKFLMSFQQYRGGMDTHQILLWADKERQMLKHFFSNLITYCKNRKKSKQLANESNRSDSSVHSSHDMYSHTEEIQTRLSFLNFVFSSAGSPDNFRLSQEQIDILWSSLATDPDSADELFNWLLGRFL